MIGEAEAIDWCEQRLALENDQEARAIMANPQQEGFKHFAADLEFLLRRKPRWRIAGEKILLQHGTSTSVGKRQRKPRARSDD